MNGLETKKSGSKDIDKHPNQGLLYPGMALAIDNDEQQELYACHYQE